MLRVVNGKRIKGGSPTGIRRRIQHRVADQWPSSVLEQDPRKRETDKPVSPLHGRKYRLYWFWRNTTPCDQRWCRLLGVHCRTLVEQYAVTAVFEVHVWCRFCPCLLNCSRVLFWYFCCVKSYLLSYNLIIFTKNIAFLIQRLVFYKMYQQPSGSRIADGSTYGAGTSSSNANRPVNNSHLMSIGSIHSPNYRLPPPPSYFGPHFIDTARPTVPKYLAKWCVVVKSMQLEQGASRLVAALSGKY